MPTIKPNPTETQGDYVERCFRTMGKMSVDDRNRICFDSWKSARGENEAEAKARKMFEPDRFEKRENVCVFAEHETVDKHGEPQKYDRAALQDIVDKANERIADTGDFATMS